ncbi:MAG TPA: serine/threonine-protein kinase [Thermoanaerobaculia bacterium]|nr:serine/threonine-protein kinase [Thermoanaerobaculia bacterium]
MSSITLGKLLDGKYEIVGLLGAGGMGEVYKARHVHLNTFRCIKVMRPALLADDSYRQRFLREARLATQIQHPNIAVVHDFELLDDGSSYMVTEFIDGTTLRQWGSEYGRFPLPLAAEITVQVLGGLDAIHRRGLLHRDISADNVMLAFDGEDRLVVKIIDLGVAKDVAAVTDTTQSGMLIGNPKYMSPEQLGELDEGEQLDGRADLYCLGVVLYEMLIGVPPFTAKTPNGYIVKKLTESPPPFRQLQPDLTLPNELEAVVMRALEKDRRKRYADAREFARAMEPFLTRATGTYTRGEVTRLRKGERRTRETPMPTEVVSSDAVAPPAEVAFQSAWENGSTTAWRRFLDAHAKSPEAERARSLLAEAADFERAVDETELREFLRRWPEGRHRLDAQIRLVDVRRQSEQRAWAEAVAADTFTGVRDFLAHHGASAHAEEAQRLLEERLAFETAATLDSESSWDDYLKTHENDRHAPAARERRDAARQREDDAFFAAVGAKTSEAWQDFLDRYPSGRRAARAEGHRREALAFESARDMGAEALERFVTFYPEGLLVKEARRMIKRASDEHDAQQAREVDTPAAWQLYLMTHPGGAAHEDAQRRLTELDDAAFAAVLASKSAASAEEFAKTFPQSARRAEAEKLAAKWGETGAVQQALDAIARGDGEAAVPLLAKISEPELRKDVEQALESWRDERAWSAAKAENTIGALQGYLDAWPKGHFIAEAAKRLKKLRAAAGQREPRDFDQAWEGGTSAAWDEYFAQHPDSSRLAEARRCRDEAVAFEAALAANTTSLWRAFMKAWPEGRHRLDAELRLKK